MPCVLSGVDQDLHPAARAWLEGVAESASCPERLVSPLSFLWDPGSICSRLLPLLRPKAGWLLPPTSVTPAFCVLSPSPAEWLPQGPGDRGSALGPSGTWGKQTLSLLWGSSGLSYLRTWRRQRLSCRSDGFVWASVRRTLLSLIPNEGNGSESSYSGEGRIVPKLAWSPRCCVVGPTIFTVVLRNRLVQGGAYPGVQMD